MNYVPCPLCGKDTLCLWHKVDGLKLHPSRCSVCLRTVGNGVVTVAQAQEILARKLEGTDGQA